MPVLRLKSCFQAFENHWILRRNEVVEGSLVKRVFAEESEHPLCTDLLTTREWDLLSRQIAGLGDGRADPLDELPFRFDWQPRRDDKVTDGAHWASEFAVNTGLLGRPLAKEHSCVRNHVGVVDGFSDLLDQFFLDIDSKAGWQIYVSARHNVFLSLFRFLFLVFLFNDATSQRATSGQSFFVFGGV
jgi:hypothetical protein